MVVTPSKDELNQGTGRGAAPHRPLAREEPEEIRDFGVAMPHAVGRPRNGEALVVRELVDAGGEDGGARGRSRLEGNGPALYGNAREELDDRGGRYGNEAVLAFHEAPAELDARAEHSIGGEVFDADRGPYDVHDRIDGAHLVEGHVLDDGAVHLRLRSGEPFEDGGGPIPRPLGEAAPLDHLPDVAVRAMAVDLGLGAHCAESRRHRDGQDIDVGPGPRYPHLRARREAQSPTGQAELRELGHEMILGNAEIDEGGEGHVATYPRKAIEV